MSEKTPVQPGTILRRMLPSLVFNAALPLIVYTLLREPLGDFTALAIGAGIPVVVTLAEFLWRRRVDAVGIVVIAGFAVVLVGLGLSGGNPLVLKLHDAVVTGPLGLVLLASAAIGKPLLGVVAKMMAKRGGAQGVPPRRAMSVMTALVGAVMFLHALLILVLALTLSTETFLAVGRPIGWAVIAAGLFGLWTYRNRLRAKGTAAAR